MARDLPSLNAIRMFEAAARYRNFTKAAEALHVTQGAVSRQIKHLEADLGQDLFRRAGPRIELTDSGERLYEAVAESLAILRRTTLELKRKAASPTLTISVLPSFAAKWLIHQIPEFHAAHANLELRMATSYEAVNFTEHPDIDLAIRFGAGGWSGVYSERLVTEKAFPVCSPEFLRRHGGRLHPSKLAELPLLYASEEYDQWAEWFAAVNVKPPSSAHVYRYSDIAVLLQAAIAGQGVALARSLVAAKDLELKFLLRPFEAAIPSRFGYHFVCSSGRETETNVARFLEWIRQKCSSVDE